MAVDGKTGPGQLRTVRHRTPQPGQTAPCPHLHRAVAAGLAPSAAEQQLELAGDVVCKLQVVHLQHVALAALGNNHRVLQGRTQTCTQARAQAQGGWRVGEQCWHGGHLCQMQACKIAVPSRT